MPEEKLKSPVDGRIIDITRLNRWQLRDIHYQEEIKMAKMILELPPFSEERKKLLNEGYAFVETLKLRYEKADAQESFGASPMSVKAVKDIIESRTALMKCGQVVYEAGVGLGYALREIIELPKVKFYGCDVNLFDDVAEMCKMYHNLILHERTLYEDLMHMEDNSIDVFYADNVFEHLIPDEVDTIIDILYRKMKKGGVIILFIPNWNNGPHDVTMYYLEKGQKATGFHFMEMSYFETMKLMCSHRFKPSYILKENRVEKDNYYLKNLKRLLTEWFIYRMKNSEVKSELMKYDNYSGYIYTK